MASSQLYCIYREGEGWKQQRVAINKQALPRTVNSYIEGLNPIYNRFSDHLRKIRSEDGLIEDFTQLSRKLTMEGIIISGLTDAIKWLWISITKTLARVYIHVYECKLWPEGKLL